MALTPHWGDARPTGKPRWGAHDPSGIEHAPLTNCEWGVDTPLANTSGVVNTPTDTAVRGHLTRGTFLVLFPSAHRALQVRAGGAQAAHKVCVVAGPNTSVLLLLTTIMVLPSTKLIVRGIIEMLSVVSSVFIAPRRRCRPQSHRCCCC